MHTTQKRFLCYRAKPYLNTIMPTAHLSFATSLGTIVHPHPGRCLFTATLFLPLPLFLPLWVTVNQRKKSPPKRKAADSNPVQDAKRSGITVMPDLFIYKIMRFQAAPMPLKRNQISLKTGCRSPHRGCPGYSVVASDRC